jgi:Lar family restriction alleviation protein
MTTDLNPCPFCGSIAVPFNISSNDYKRNWSYGVDCSVCTARTEMHRTAEAAARHWNQLVSG